jgi:hypothetical protein
MKDTRDQWGFFLFPQYLSKKPIMGKLVRLSEGELVNLIKKILSEQSTPSKSPEECVMLRRKKEKNIARGQRVINFAPKALRSILKKAFDAGITKGPEAFKAALPKEANDVLNKKMKTIKMPKSESEIESMISSAQMEAQNLNLQEQVKSVLGLIVNIGMILMVLWVIVILVRNADGDIAGYCG